MYANKLLFWLILTGLLGFHTHSRKAKQKQQCQYKLLKKQEFNSQNFNTYIEWKCIFSIYFCLLFWWLVAEPISFKSTYSYYPVFLQDIRIRSYKEWGEKAYLMASDDLMKWGFRKITKPGNTENRVVNSMQLPLWTNFHYVVENLSTDKTTYPPPISGFTTMPCLCYVLQPNSHHFQVINQKPLPSVYPVIFYWLYHASTVCNTVKWCWIFSIKTEHSLLFQQVTVWTVLCQSNVKLIG